MGVYGSLGTYGSLGVYGSLGAPTEPGGFTLTATRSGSTVNLVVDGAPEAGTVTVSRTSPDQVLVRTIVDRPVLLLAGAEATDYEVPQNVAVSYQAELTATDGSTYLSSVATVTAADQGSDLLIPLAPPGATPVAVTVEAQREQVREAAAKPVGVLGEKYPIPLTAPRGTWQGPLSLVVFDDASRDTLLTLLDPGHPVAFVPRYPAYGAAPVEYLSVRDVTVTRSATLGTNTASVVELDVISITPPVYRSTP